MPYSNGLTGTISTADLEIERLLETQSAASSQQPSGLGVSNARQIEFGGPQGNVATPYSLAANGTLTINTAGLYYIKVALQIGRTGSNNTAELLFRVLVNGAQAGRSLSWKLTNSKDESYVENDNWLNLSAGTELKFELMRDIAGADDGGLIAVIPTDEGTNVWNEAPTAYLKLERFVGQVVPGSTSITLADTYGITTQIT